MYSLTPITDEERVARRMLLKQETAGRHPQGKAERIDLDVSYKLAFKRGGYRRLAIAKAICRVVGKDGDSQVATAFAPLECFPRSLAAPSALAHVLSKELTDGMPLNRPREPHWTRTRARLDARELAAEVGSLTIPPPLAATLAEEYTAAN